MKGINLLSENSVTLKISIEQDINKPVAKLTVQCNSPRMLEDLLCNTPEWLSKMLKLHNAELHIENKSVEYLVQVPSTLLTLERIEKRCGLLNLTERQSQVAVGICNGYSRKDIADRLMISVDTVNTHFGCLGDVVGIKDQTVLVDMFTCLDDIFNEKYVPIIIRNSIMGKNKR